MKILAPPWRAQLESFLKLAKHDLRVAAPYYSKEVIKRILQQCGKGVRSRFLLALTDRDVKAGSQSTAAIELAHKNPLSDLRLITNLHAKLLIADNKKAIVTSSNLTGAGLDSNVEIGVYIDEPEQVKELIAVYEHLWSKGGSLDPQVLKKLKSLSNTATSQKSGKTYGKHVKVSSTLTKTPTKLSANGEPPPGWILIHSHERFGGEEGDSTPKDELKEYYAPGMLWHWQRGKPLNEGGPYRLLLAWEGIVFGEAKAMVTHKIRRKDFNFAFVFQFYKARKPVSLDALPLSKSQHEHHRDLIRLNPRILKEYDALKG